MTSIKISVITSLYRCAPFLESFLHYYSTIINPNECELILVHNDPTHEELQLIDEHRSALVNLVHLCVEREGLYASWNRAIKEARGKYMAVWNVDDIRTPNSLAAQQMALERSSGVLCYGDFYGTSQYGTYQEKLYEYPEYESGIKEAFKRHIIGCFPMWRKDIHSQVGYFDEQFKLVSDYEFQLRLIRSYSLVKAPVLLGYYLDHSAHKLSSNRQLQHRERTTVEYRYHMYNKILLHHLPAVLRYKPTHILNFNSWISVNAVASLTRLVTPKELLLLAGMPFYYGNWLIKKIFSRLYDTLFQ